MQGQRRRINQSIIICNCRRLTAASALTDEVVAARRPSKQSRRVGQSGRCSWTERGTCLCRSVCHLCVQQRLPNLVQLVLLWFIVNDNKNEYEYETERVLAINKGREIRVHGEPGIGPGLGPLPVRSAGSRLICSNLTNVWQILSASSAANESQLPLSKQKRSLVARAKSLTRASACVSSHLLLFMIIICCSWCCFFQFYTIHTFTHAWPSWTWQLVVIHDRLNVT